MKSLKGFLAEKYEALAGGSSGHYGHLPDNAYYGSKAAGAAAALYGSMQHRHGRMSDLVPQKKTDGKVSVVTVRNHKDSPFHNPKHPETAVGVAYKGRLDSKTIPHNERVAYSKDEVKKHYGESHHLTPMLSKLVDHAHKIHGEAHIIQHDVHTTEPEKDIHHEKGKATWQPNTIRNHTTDPHEISKLKKAKVVLASHTAFDKDFKHARGLVDGKDIKHHPDVYNVNLTVPKIDHKEVDEHNKAIGSHLKNAATRSHLDKVAHASYQGHLERFTNSKVNAGEYGGPNHKPLSHAHFKEFVAKSHDKEIEKAKSEKGKQAKTAIKHAMLKDIDRDKDSINKAFDVHHTFTKAVAHYVHKTHQADAKSPIKHELPDGKGGYKPAPFEGIVPRGTHPAVNTQKFNDRAEFNRMNKISGEQRFGKKPVNESTESKHAVIVPGARFQPVHRGHEGLVNDAVNKAKKVGGKAHIYVTQNKSGDPKNPLSAEHRVEMLNHAFKDHVKAGHLQFHVGSGMHANLSHFHKNNPHVEHAHVVLGDDRQDAGESLKKYNNKPDKSGKTLYKFKTLETHTREKTPSKYDSIHATELRNKANSSTSDQEKHKFFKERMHPNIPDHLIHKTIKDIQKTHTMKESNIMDRLSFSQFITEQTTGCHADPKMTNIGSTALPHHIKSSEELPVRQQDGATHHVGGFVPPDQDGDSMIHHQGEIYSNFDGPITLAHTGEQAFPFVNDSGNKIKITKSGHIHTD